MIQYLTYMAKVICKNVNDAQRENYPILMIPNREEEFIYQPLESLVLSDIIGRDDAGKYIRSELGPNYASPFEENQDYIHEIFRSGEFPNNLQGFLSAPDDEVWKAF